ncbi:MAG: hypothetical protein WD278_06000 [Pirellulales bacterium]
MVVDRDLDDAAVPALSADRRFATAYNAALQVAKMAIACAGYRVIGVGAHQTTFEAVQLAVGGRIAPLALYFETCRRKRNRVDYDAAHIVSDAEAQEIRAQAEQLRTDVEAWIASQHPQFRP